VVVLTVSAIGCGAACIRKSVVKGRSAVLQITKVRKKLVSRLLGATYVLMKQQIVHVALVVDDYDEAIKFYTEKLDFTWLEDTPQTETKRWV
jgi:catechol-2,3-dioxygenase